MIQLGKAGGELAAAGAGGGNDDQWAGGLNVGVGTVAGIADDGIYVGG